MIRAYDKLYLEDAMNNLGAMLDYAVNQACFDLTKFYDMFLKSGVATQFSLGNPQYIAGMSGPELARAVVVKCFGDDFLMPPAMVLYDRSPEYWAGWALCYYQWYSAKSFSRLNDEGLTIATVLRLYRTLHEADISKFVDTANTIIQTTTAAMPSRLQAMRKKRGLTQKELADRSGVSLRCVQLYEQKQQDITTAEVRNILSLAKVLQCQVSDLI